MSSTVEYFLRTTYDNTNLCLLCGKVFISGEKVLAVSLHRAWGDAEYEICQSCAIGIAEFVESNKLHKE